MLEVVRMNEFKGTPGPWRVNTITEPAEHLMSKLRVMPELEKSFEVATPQEKTTKKKKAE
jgi:hypothetical protein